jgi:very-short-patch-repair endonuclease
VAVHPTIRLPARAVAVGSIRYAPPARAIADAARQLTDLREVRAIVASAVQRDKCKLGQLADEVATGPVRGSALLRQVLAEVADGIRSTAEGDFMDLIKGAQLPMPEFNVRLVAADGSFIAVADAWWRDAGVVGEVDSRAWHLSPEDHERDLSRHDRMSRHGIIVLHFTPKRIRADKRGVIAELSDALRAGRARPPLTVRTEPGLAAHEDSRRSRSGSSGGRNTSSLASISTAVHQP